MLYLRALLFYLGYWLATLLIGSLCLFLFLFPKSIARCFILFWINFVLFWLRACCGVSVELHGNVKALAEPCVIVANHQSPWETFFFQRYFVPLSTILKKELLKIPFFGWGLKLMQPVAIDRSNPVQALKQIKAQGVDRVKSGNHLLVFPEGTRRPVGELGDYKRSAADVAQQAGAAIIAVAHNAGQHWPNKKFVKQPGKIQVIISEPFVSEGQSTKALMNSIQNWTQKQLEEIYAGQK